jgi:diguanylate cyclase (GGDEF)-like protein
MKKEMINLIHQVIEDDSKLKSLECIYELYDQLQYSESLLEMAESLYVWLKQKYAVDNIHFSLFDLDNNESISLLKDGDEFYLDDKFAFYFIINTHTQINAVVSFAANDQEHYDRIYQDYSFIEAAFFQISPILQNGIIKKHHIEASSVDSVTNVYNRKYLINHLGKVLALSDKRNSNIAFLMVGVDRFKAVIEEFDYDIGDRVLIELAKIIHGQIKDFDLVARLTGDEFLVTLINNPDLETAVDVAKKIIEEFAELEIIVDKENGQYLKKTVCIGISLYPDHSSDINQVLKNSDNFLSEARNKGRSQYAVYEKQNESTIDLF